MCATDNPNSLLYLANNPMEESRAPLGAARAAMISALFFVNLKGEIVIARMYR
jgi:hypothetical protein